MQGSTGSTQKTVYNSKKDGWVHIYAHSYQFSVIT